MKKPIKDLESACKESTKELSNVRSVVMKPKGKGKKQTPKAREKLVVVKLAQVVVVVVELLPRLWARVCLKLLQNMVRRSNVP